MLSQSVVVVAALLWVGALFAVALLDEKRAPIPPRFRPLVYALSLAVYCTSWTFFGTVTQALRSGAWIPPTFVGTILLYAFGWRFLARLARLAHEHNSTSIADLVATRFGRSTLVAALVTAVAVLGMVPYIALQLKAVATSYALITAGAQHAVVPPAWQDSAFWVAVAMGAFAMLIGTRRAAVAERNQGLVLAIAFESLLKLGAMLALGGFALFFLQPASALPVVPSGPPAAAGSYAALVGLGALAMFTLPHQFHIGVIECADERQVKTARWLFPLYLLAIALPIPLIAAAGMARLHDSAIPSDLYVLGLPLAAGHQWLALLAFLGGLSAATGMVILAALTLSVMIGNHWAAPLLVAAGWGRPGRANLAESVVVQRRFGIALLLMLAYGYSRVLVGSEALADIGALSFSILAQLAPAVLAAVYWPRLPPRAIGAGIVAGVAVWIWLVLRPTLFVAEPGSSSLLAWTGLDRLDLLARGTLLSLAVNLLAIFLLRGTQARRQATNAAEIPLPALHALASRFLDPPSLQRAFAAHGEISGRAEPLLEARVAHELSAVIGAASARLLLDAARRSDASEIDTVATIVGEASQALRFNQTLLEAALENMSQGISVVDRELRLVAWNQRYARLFDYPSELLQIGTPVEALVRFNVARGVLGAGEADTLVERRLAHMREGSSYVTERSFPDGSVIEIHGTPMPGGGFVATFTDISAFRRAEDELKRSNETLEQRVAARTTESESARLDAERANRAKSRFIAAITHDLLQPLNAAHLFTHALAQQLQHPQYRAAVSNIDGALTSTESLLSGLLDISRLDSGGMQVRLSEFALGDMLASLASEYSVLAGDRGVVLRCVPTRLWVHSDAQLLRRILQNFLSNAVRYSERGRALIGCRRRGSRVSIEVWDSGSGIAEADRSVIFEEFRRLEGSSARPGLGLGLAIADRTARLLEHPLSLRSWPGRGSVFCVEVPCVAAALRLPEAARPAPALLRMRVLLVDNEPDGLRALASLLEAWGASVATARDALEVERRLAEGLPDLVVLDYHLDGGETGLSLRAQNPVLASVPAILVTADHSDAVHAAAAAVGVPLLNKPVRPLALKSLLARIVVTRPADRPGVAAPDR